MPLYSSLGDRARSCLKKIQLGFHPAWSSTERRSHLGQLSPKNGARWAGAALPEGQAERGWHVGRPSAFQRSPQASSHCAGALCSLLPDRHCLAHNFLQAPLRVQQSWVRDLPEKGDTDSHGALCSFHWERLCGQGAVGGADGDTQDWPDPQRLSPGRGHLTSTSPGAVPASRSQASSLGKPLTHGARILTLVRDRRGPLGLGVCGSWPKKAPAKSTNCTTKGSETRKFFIAKVQKRSQQQDARQ